MDTSKSGKVGERKQKATMDRNKKRVTYMTGANSTLSTYGMNELKKKK